MRIGTGECRAHCISADDAIVSEPPLDGMACKQMLIVIIKKLSHAY